MGTRGAGWRRECDERGGRDGGGMNRDEGCSVPGFSRMWTGS